VNQWIEPGPGIRAGWQGIQCNLANIAAAVTALVFTLTGSVILFATVASNANLTQQQANSWIMMSLIPPALISLVLCLYYKQPIFIAPSLPALLVMGPMFKVFTVPEMVGGYLVAGVCVGLLGVTGIVGRIGKYLPIPIIMGMIAGVFMGYGLRIVEAVQLEPLVAGGIIASFLVTPWLTKRLPPQAASLLVAILLSLLLFPSRFQGGTAAYAFSWPVFVWPEFKASALLAVSVPLVLMALADTMKGYGVLKANRFDPPLNGTTAAAGLMSILSAFGLAHVSSLAGPVTAILGGDAAGTQKHRYVAGLLFFPGLLLIGLTTGFLMPFLRALPAAVSYVIAGLAMLGLFTSSLEMAFGTKRFQVGAFTALIIGMANVTLWGVGAPVWAILVGVGVSFFLERDHFRSCPGRKDP
jgi:benzoate membrane transport protein